MIDISLEVQGSKLCGKLFTLDAVASNPAILFLHGWTSKQDRYFGFAKALVAKGYICLTFDMRGHGMSEGELVNLSRTDFLEDTIAAYDFLANAEGVNPSRIIVVGSSFGGYLATLLSEKRSCSGLALRVPADYPNSGFDEPHIDIANAYYEGLVDAERRAWKTTVHLHTETNSLEALHAFSGKVLLVESEMDELVPHEIVQSYASAVADKSKLTHHVMKGAPHSLGNDPERQHEFSTILTTWLESK